MPFSITAFSLVMVFGAFVLLGVFVARGSEEAPMKVAGYFTAVAFGLMAVIVPFVMYHYYVFYDLYRDVGSSMAYYREAGRISDVEPSPSYERPRVVYRAVEGRCRVDSGDVVQSPTGCWYKSSEGETEWMEPMVVDDSPIEWVLPSR